MRVLLGVACNSASHPAILRGAKKTLTNTILCNFPDFSGTKSMNTPKTLSQLLDEQQARAERGPWYPASNGTEIPFVTRGGFRLLYMWQPSTKTHAYINLDTDMFISDSEIDAILA